MCKVKDLKDACEFHQFYLKQTEDETLDEILIYAALWLERYELALELIKKIFAETITSFEEDYEGDFCEYEEICQEEIEIVNAIQRKDCDYIDRCLKNNKKYNLEILRKIGLDINRRS